MDASAEVSRHTEGFTLPDNEIDPVPVTKIVCRFAPQRGRRSSQRRIFSRRLGRLNRRRLSRKTRHNRENPEQLEGEAAIAQHGVSQAQRKL